MPRLGLVAEVRVFCDEREVAGVICGYGSVLCLDSGSYRNLQCDKMAESHTNTGTLVNSGFDLFYGYVKCNHWKTHVKGTCGLHVLYF